MRVSDDYADLKHSNRHDVGKSGSQSEMLAPIRTNHLSKLTDMTEMYPRKAECRKGACIGGWGLEKQTVCPECDQTENNRHEHHFCFGDIQEVVVEGVDAGHAMIADYWKHSGPIRE